MALVSTNHCRGCKHYFVARLVSGEGVPACCYAANKRMRRPCPAGEGCTAYEPAGERSSTWSKWLRREINLTRRAEQRIKREAQAKTEKLIIREVMRHL